ncbi:MAG TPA: hypothetical protein VG939_03650, partial [Caulobacteraceae bacterium]|nr:hypothetical protein [Caulobacteraceae bacterium]
MAPALILALALASANTPPPADTEPLPPGAPQDEYLLAGWCYGALAEYLEIYDQVKPDLVAIDKEFGSPVKEDEPYQSDVAALRAELKIFAGAIEAAEKASAQPIAPQGAQAIRAGQSIWQSAETKTRRELARAWLSWGLPDRCDTNARALHAKASILGKALTYNAGASSPAPAAPASPDAAGGDGAVALAPIAPVVTHDAAAPSPYAMRAAMASSAGPAAPPPSDSMSATSPAASAPPEAAAPEAPVPAPGSRVLEAETPAPAEAGP